MTETGHTHFIRSVFTQVTACGTRRADVIYVSCHAKMVTCAKCKKEMRDDRGAAPPAS